MRLVKDLGKYSIYEDGCCGSVLYVCAYSKTGIIVRRDLTSIEECEAFILNASK
jgi:hypothetical protein